MADVNPDFLDLKIEEAMLPEFEYTAPQFVQNSVHHTYYDQIQPMANNIAHGAAIEFLIPKSPDYTALHETRLALAVRVTKEDGVATSFGAAQNPDKVCVANNVAHTIFKSVEIWINGKECEDLSNYAYRAYLDSLTTYRHDSLFTRSDLQGWRKDHPGKFNTFEYADDIGGMKDRTDPFKNSNTVYLIARLHTDIMTQGLCIPSNYEIKIRLNRSNDNFALIAAKDKKYEIRVDRASLWVNRVKLNKSLQEAHEKMFEKHQKLLFPMRRVGVKHFTIPMGTQKKTLSNLFDGNLPDRFLVGFLSNASYAGTQINSNPFNFQHFNVVKLQASVGERCIPNVAYEPNFSTGEYIREYYALLEEFNADEGDNTLNIGKTEFAHGYTLFPFRLVERARGGDLLGFPASGNLSLSLEFAGPVGENINVLLYYEQRSVLGIAKQ